MSTQYQCRYLFIHFLLFEIELLSKWNGKEKFEKNIIFYYWSINLKIKIVSSMRRRHDNYVGCWISYFEHDAWLFHFLFWCVKISCTIAQRVRWWRWWWWRCYHQRYSRFTFMHSFIVIDYGIGWCCINGMGRRRSHIVVTISVHGWIMWMLLNWNVRRWWGCIDGCRHCIVITKCGKFICIRWLGIWLRKFTTANSTFKQWITEIMYVPKRDGTFY